MDDLYCGYGSNTDPAHLDEWCRSQGHGAGLFQPVGLAELPDVELAFNYFSRGRQGGALNLRERRGSLVSGLLLKVLPGGWAALDRKEGVGSRAYRRVRRHAIGAYGEAIPVSTYVATPADEAVHHAPADGYVETVLKGYATCGIDPDPLNAAAAGRPAGSDLSALFFYGTLLRGEARAHVVGDAGPSCIILGEVRGTLLDLGPYPGLVPARPGGPDSWWVDGEFVRIPDIGTVLEKLDAIEDARPFGTPDGLYRRTVVDVGVGDGRVRRAWTYAAGGAAPVIRSGSWREHRGRREAALRAIAAAHMAAEPLFLERLAVELRSVFCPEAPPPFPMKAEDVVQALARGDLWERQMARASGRWAVEIPRLVPAAS